MKYLPGPILLLLWCEVSLLYALDVYIYMFRYIYICIYMSECITSIRRTTTINVALCAMRVLIPYLDTVTFYIVNNTILLLLLLWICAMILFLYVYLDYYYLLYILFIIYIYYISLYYYMVLYYYRLLFILR